MTGAYTVPLYGLHLIIIESYRNLQIPEKQVLVIVSGVPRGRRGGVAPGGTYKEGAEKS